MESEENISNVMNVDATSMENNTHDNQYNTGFRGSMNSSRYGGADQMGPKERGSGFLSPVSL
jgi:hypothetical protein